MSVKVKDVSMNHDNKKFVLHFSGTSTSCPYIAPGTSAPMLSVRYRLEVSGLPIPQSVWYKDEGGREKCMEMKVHLINSEGRLVVDRKMRLKVLLLYESEIVVPNQAILKLTDDTRVVVDESGTALIKFRIDEVSRAHQKQRFKLQVSPDINHDPLNSDVSPVISVAVEVRSKRNNNKLNKDKSDFSENPSKHPS